MSTEQPQPTADHITDSEAILKAEGEVLDTWARLPVVHQAALLVLLAEHMRTQEQGEWWLEGVIKQVADSPEQRLGVPFEITSVNRVDVAQKLGLEDAADFSDEEMRQLATKMAGIYVETGGFWDDLELFASQMVADKKQEPAEPDLEQ